MRKILALALLVIGTTGMVYGVAEAVPEIDGGSAVSAIALVGSALLMVRRKKAN